MGSLAGKVAIVTGASNGIGRAIAERLAQDGATVVVNYGKSADKAKAVVAGIVSRGGNAVAIQADMSKVSDARRLVRETVQRFGRLDILVNNAGMFMYKPLVETRRPRKSSTACLPSMPRAPILRCRKRRRSSRKGDAS